MSPTDLRALLERAKMTQKEGAALCGVTSRQFQNWIAGKTPVPILAENALIAEEGARADTDCERDTQTPADARAALEWIAAEQKRRIASLERDLKEERTALAETLARIEKSSQIQDKTMNNQKGITLIELIITLSIAMVLIAVAVPSFKTVMTTNTLATTANTISASIALAKSEAVTRGKRVSICPSRNTNDAEPVCDIDGHWSDGWVVFIDTGDRLSIDGDDEILKIFQRIDNTAEIMSYAYSQGISINALGASVDDTDNLIDGEIEIAFNEEFRCVDINNMARPKIERGACLLDEN